jgi:3-dehydroquinate synthase
MLSDKKVRRGILRFVLLDGIANPRTEAVEPGELAAPAEAIGIRP